MLRQPLILLYQAEWATEALQIVHPKSEGFLVFKRQIFSVVLKLGRKLWTEETSVALLGGFGFLS